MEVPEVMEDEIAPGFKRSYLEVSKSARKGFGLRASTHYGPLCQGTQFRIQGSGVSR